MNAPDSVFHHPLSFEVKRLREALTHIARHAYAQKDWQFAQAILAGDPIQEAKRKTANPRDRLLTDKLVA